MRSKLVCNMRADTEGRVWPCTTSAVNMLLCTGAQMTVKTLPNINFEVTNKFYPVDKVANIESVNNVYCECGGPAS